MANIVQQVLGMSDEDTNKVLESIIGRPKQELDNAVEKLNAKIENIQLIQPKDGKKGDKGDQGPIGPKGADGLPGKDGRDGRDGKDGIDGINGIDGKNGVSVIDASVEFDNSIVFTLDNGNIIDAGQLNIPKEALSGIIQSYVREESTGAGMVYPSGTGIAVVTSGTSWGTTLTAPSGTIVGTTDTQTLTNKIITSRINSTASSSSITIAANTTDQYNVTALAVGTTFNAPTGSPTDGQKLIIRIKDNGTARTLAWTGTTGGFRVVGVTLPTTTVANKTFYIASIYNSADSFWDVISVAQQV